MRRDLAGQPVGAWFRRYWSSTPAVGDGTVGGVAEPTGAQENYVERYVGRMFCAWGMGWVAAMML